MCRGAQERRASEGEGKDSTEEDSMSMEEKGKGKEEEGREERLSNAPPPHELLHLDLLAALTLSCRLTITAGGTWSTSS